MIEYTIPVRLEPTRQRDFCTPQTDKPPGRLPASVYEIQRREFRRRFIDEPRLKERRHYLETGEWRVIA